MALKITGIEAFQVRREDDRGCAPVGAPAGAPAGAWVRIATDAGVTGLGEASPAEGALALSIAASVLAPLLAGQDPLDTEVLRARMTGRTARVAPESAVAAALAAIDIALWDIKGQALGQPVYRLLGGAARSALPFCAAVDCNSGRGVAEVVQAVDAAREAEPALIKLRAGGQHGRRDADVEGDIAKARAVRRHLGPGCQLAFDGGAGYSVAGAVAVGRALEELGFEWFEEPVQPHRMTALREVAEALEIAVAAGQHTSTLQGLRQLADCGVRMLQPDITRMGGFTGLKAAAALADAYGVDLVPHQAQPVIGHTANLHLNATLPHGAHPCQTEDWTGRQQALFHEAPQLKGGMFRLPEGPGLGLRVDEAELARRRQDVRG